jgi:hypothetical protein
MTDSTQVQVWRCLRARCEVQVRRGVRARCEGRP